MTLRFFLHILTKHSTETLFYYRNSSPFHRITTNVYQAQKQRKPPSSIRTTSSPPGPAPANAHTKTYNVHHLPCCHYPSLYKTTYTTTYIACIISYVSFDLVIIHYSSILLQYSTLQYITVQVLDTTVVLLLQPTSGTSTFTFVHLYQYYSNIALEQTLVVSHRF